MNSCFLIDMKNKIFLKIVYVFAFIGFVFFVVFLSMQFGWLNVRGSTEERNEFFGQVKKTDNTNGCLNAPTSNKEEVLCAWVDTAEWEVVREGLKKDAEIIKDVSNKTGVSARMIVASVVPEQIRFFTSNRESFKRYFEPMKLLGSMSQFSLGVSGIKQETANDIEKYANDPTSPFYPGEGIADLLKYSQGVNHDTELYKRLTDAKNHYYSYLYTAVYLKEIEIQWKNAGFEVRDRPDVLVTLFNLGFKASNPKPNPQVAGSAISVGGK
ncbi:MAG: hypothetical protein NTW98_00135, partial [Candidatus Nomurabacteria bacterium]|nr:hypothetical protein [Candidatus Nomurabacteria bacterium]